MSTPNKVYQSVCVWGRPPTPAPSPASGPVTLCARHPDPSWPCRRTAASGCRGFCRICASYLGQGEAGGEEALSRPICPSLSDVLSYAFSAAIVLWGREVVCCVTARGWPGRGRCPVARTEDAPPRGSSGSPWGAEAFLQTEPASLSTSHPSARGKGLAARNLRPIRGLGCSGVAVHHVENRRRQNRINRGQFPPGNDGVNGGAVAKHRLSRPGLRHSRWDLSALQISGEYTM